MLGLTAESTIVGGQDLSAEMLRVALFTDSDAFAGTNVLSVVVEVPKTLLGGSGSINVWLETKKKI